MEPTEFLMTDERGENEERPSSCLCAETCRATCAC